MIPAERPDVAGPRGPPRTDLGTALRAYFDGLSFTGSARRRQCGRTRESATEGAERLRPPRGANLTVRSRPPTRPRRTARRAWSGRPPASTNSEDVSMRDELPRVTTIRAATDHLLASPGGSE